jgi:hypothetical protein
MTQTKTSDEGGPHSFLTHHSSTGCERKWVYDVDVPTSWVLGAYDEITNRPTERSYGAI